MLSATMAVEAVGGLLNAFFTHDVAFLKNVLAGVFHVEVYISSFVYSLVPVMNK
jgi:hypothetical protein